MLDVALIGGGLCGLALAHSLQARRIDWMLYEARPRLGGRILTAHASDGTPLDLGPTWFWPATQPSITRLVADLKLATLAQPDDGELLLLDDAAQPAAPRAFDPQRGGPDPHEDARGTPGSLHGGARRLAGGVGALVDALAQRLPGHRLHTGHVLQRVIDHGDHVELRFADGRSVQARRVVLALPPRLVAEHLAFSPALDAARQAALAQTPTWMAAAAKAALRTARAPWRGQRGAGNAWVTHAQAVLAELWDSGRGDLASGPSAASAEAPGALAGFYAIGAEQRPAFRRAAAVLLESAVAMVHGPQALPIESHVQDWAEEPHTCSAQDRAEDGRLAAHPVYGEPVLQAAAWDGRLWFGGSETAAQGGGYMEGALAAAARLRRQLTEAANEPAAPVPALDGRAAAPATAAAPASAVSIQARTAALIDDFSRRVAALREQALERYRQRVHLALSQQQDLQLTQRAVLGALESVYQEALGLLGSLRLPVAGQPLQQGRHALTPQVLAPFKGLADELLAEVVRYNATSCALSNFPFEHKPSAEYVHVIRRDLAAAWQDFALAANDHLKAHA